MVTKNNGNRLRSLTLTAQNQFTDKVSIKRGGFVNITGTFTATVVLQRLNEDGTTWQDITDNSGNIVSMTTAGRYTINPQSIAGIYRAGCKTGGFTSVTGTVTVTLEGR